MLENLAAIYSRPALHLAVTGQATYVAASFTPLQSPVVPSPVPVLLPAGWLRMCQRSPACPATSCRNVMLKKSRPHELGSMARALSTQNGYWRTAAWVRIKGNSQAFWWLRTFIADLLLLEAWHTVLLCLLARGGATATVRPLVPALNSMPAKVPWAKQAAIVMSVCRKDAMTAQEIKIRLKVLWGGQIPLTGSPRLRSTEHLGFDHNFLDS